MTNDIVITGMGAVTPIGATVESFWQSNLHGKSGLGFESQMDLSGLPCGWVVGTIPGDIKQSIATRWGTPGRSMGDLLMRDAVEQALDDAQFKEPLARRAGLIWVKSCPTSGSSPEEYETYMKHQAKRYCAAGDDPAAVVQYIRAQSSAPGVADLSNFPTQISKRLGAPLLTMRLEATCAGGLRAIVEAARLLQMGKVDFVVVSASVIRRTHYVLSQYAQLMALSRWKGSAAQASMPFDRRRSGMVISESAGALVLESTEHAEARGLREVHAVLGGWGLAVSTAHVTAPSLEMIERVIRTALDRSGLKADDVDTINAHGTSTRLNDVTEARALHRVFGEHMEALDVCAVKSLTGHGSGASGIIETIVAALTLCRGIVPPVVTCTEPDPECNVKTHLTPAKRPIATVTKNSFGFGGQYASMIFKRPSNPRRCPEQANEADVEKHVCT
jgi:3-oxoacyl-[acyl-carrier-protein] synthase II